MATYEEIIARARAENAKGTPEGDANALRLGKIARGMQSVPTVQQRMDAAISGGVSPESQARLDAANAESLRMMQQPDVSRLETAINAAAQGATFGLSDEMIARLGSISPNKTYGELLPEIRGRFEAGSEQHPKTALASELSGALLTGLAAGPAVGAKTSLGRAGQAAGIGAAEGALYGFGVGEGGAKERAKSAAITGAIGGIGGGALSLAGSGLGAAVNKARTSKAARGMIADTPSSNALKAAAGDLYDEALASGITASPAQTAAFASTADEIARSAGAITPKGRIAKGKPLIKDALNLIEDYSGEAMDPAQMRSVRSILSDAAQSNVKSESRLGSMMIEEFDKFTSPLTPTIANANKLFSQAMRGSVIDEAVELAGIRAGQFTGSGYENALRTEFRRLARDIVKGRLKGLSPEQVSSINRVASGGSLENIARGIGKAAPTGVVSVGSAGLMPTIAGSVMGLSNPAALALGAGTMAAGALGRKAATQMQTQNAGIAGALMRGGSMPQVAPSRIPLSTGRGNAGMNALIASLSSR